MKKEDVEQRYIDKIKQKYEELGRIPKIKEVTNGMRIGLYFEGWKNALIASGVNIKKKKIINHISKCSDEELLELIVLEAEKIGKTPTKKQMPHIEAIKRRFGSWNNAVKLAGLKPNEHAFKYTKEEITIMLIKYYKKYRKLPTITDINKSKEVPIHSDTIKRIFNKQWKEILKEIGIVN